MPIPILMPALSPTMEEGKLAKWLVKEGDKIAPGKVIAEIETDKATMEVEAVDEGVMGRIMVEAGTDKVKVNEPIAVLLAEGEDRSALASFKAPVVAPAARVLRQGENRFAFGVFSLDREQISDAEVAIYAAPRDLQGAAVGPFPARIESLETEDAFRAKSTSDDPDAAKVVYISEIPLERPGEWVFGALTKQGDGYGGSLVPTPSLVGQFDPPEVGDKAPVTDTDTAAENPDISEIDTRVPPSSMHDESLADVLGKKPVVLLFATPALCQSRICGPVVDIAEQVKRDNPDIAFIHQEIYNENDISKGTRPPVNDFRLPSEPWLFVIDAGGTITTAIEGAFSVQELERAVAQAKAKSS
ncbi:MAG: hypothetical protein F9K43_13035 [Bauldia sp.]|nr:MAG: hypothetical protein F9K43_13035 [Bauldia sp.]